jgi:hypothetical protein
MYRHIYTQRDIHINIHNINSRLGFQRLKNTDSQRPNYSEYWDWFTQMPLQYARVIVSDCCRHYALFKTKYFSQELKSDDKTARASETLCKRTRMVFVAAWRKISLVAVENTEKGEVKKQIKMDVKQIEFNCVHSLNCLGIISYDGLLRGRCQQSRVP